MCVVRHADKRYPPGRLLILSDNLALLLALCGGRSFFCIWFQGRIYLVVQVDTLRIELSDRGWRSFDCENDSTKSQLHVLARTDMHP